MMCSTFDDAQSLTEMPACLCGFLDLSAVYMAKERVRIMQSASLPREVSAFTKSLTQTADNG